MWSSSTVVVVVIHVLCLAWGLVWDMLIVAIRSICRMRSPYCDPFINYCRYTCIQVYHWKSDELDKLLTDVFFQQYFLNEAHLSCNELTHQHNLTSLVHLFEVTLYCCLASTTNFVFHFCRQWSSKRWKRWERNKWTVYVTSYTSWILLG